MDTCHATCPKFHCFVFLHSVQHIQHERFTTKQHGYRLVDLSLDLSGNIAVSGIQSIRRTYIDLYSGKDSDSRDKLKLFYSNEFENYSDYWLYRYVSFLDKNVSKLVTCIGEKIEIIDTKNESKVLRSCKVNGEIITCLAVREGEIFIGLGSKTVLVFNNDLKKTRKIKIKGIQDVDFPCDLQVIKDTVFVCTGWYGRVLSLSVYDSSTVSEYTDTTAMYSRALSIAVSEEMNLVALLWLGSRKKGIIVYSLNKNKSFLVYDVDSDVNRIRISSRDRKIITGNEKTGEIKMYDLEHEKRLDDLQGELVHVREEAHQLRKDVANSEVLMKDNETFTEELKQNKADSDRQVEILTTKLKQSEQSAAEYDKKIGALAQKLEQSEQSNVDLDRQIAILAGALEKAEQDKATSNQKILVLTEEFHQSEVDFVSQIETLTNELKQTTQTNEVISEQLTQLKAESSKRVGGLTSELSETKQELLTRSKELVSTNIELEMTKQTLERTTQDRDSIRTELEKCQLDFAKESRALREVLNKAKDAKAALHKRPFENKFLDDSEKSEDIDEGGAILAAEFGRLTVAVAEYLTLGDCLKLAKICSIPPADCDLVYRVSFTDSPAMKLLDLLKERNIINMYDVTNLQKALAMLKLEAVNQNVVAPYQKTIGEEHYEQFKTEELFTWEDVSKFVSKVKLPWQQTSKEASPDDGTQPGYASQTEVTSEAGEDDRESLIIDRPHHLLYAEQIVGREGGSIRLKNVFLTVPPDALHEDHMIAISVMNESPFPLDREVDTARMTPLIKLEPLGLTFKKPVQLNIPHSALISEPENHEVIIHLGQLRKTDDSSDSIGWTEEKSIPRQLKDKFVTVDIQRLTFLSASLRNQTSAPPLHIVRAVPFVNRVRNTADDIILTICFCSDNDSEYNMLLSDYRTKLPLEQYSTLQLHRLSEREGDDAGFLSVTVRSVNNTYIPDKDQAMKKIAVSHLCTASRVSHQIRLKKEKITYGDVVDILFTFTQAEYEPTEISLKARIKDLIISEESEKLVFGPISPGNKMYEDMLVNISSSLNAEQCKKLAAYFHLSSKHSEMITSNEDPGMMLMKTLDERSLVHPQKMIHFFEGLKACHLDETSNLVTEYINKIPTLTPGEEQKPEEEEYIEAAMEKSFQELVCKGLNSLIGTLVRIWQVYSDYPLIIRRE